MKRIITIAALALCCAAAQGAPVSAFEGTSFCLENGLTVWVNHDPYQTTEYGAVVVKAGAIDCPATGIAHYFEHMMFKGTDKIGTVDYAAEKPYLDSIALMYDRLAVTPDDSTRKCIQMEINRLNICASQYAIPNEFDNLISAAGGSSLNAFTSYDETVYHNRFLPEYFAQWAELNSERIMYPVFRLFQSELETVYEEKNRSDDNMISDFQNKMLSSLFAGSPYSEQIIGTTENLKNPRLNQMAEFFEQYYVASNMGLLLSGPLTAEEMMPVIEATFGRIRRGEPNVRPAIQLDPIEGCKDVEASINLPLLNIDGLCFRGPSKTDPDYLTVCLLSSMLNNDSATGLLDKLMSDQKLMMASCTSDISFIGAGGIIFLYMPKLMASEDKATAMIMDAIATIKNGNFSDEFFESIRSAYRKQLESSLEDHYNRAISMAFAFSAGQDWADIVAQPEKVAQITREDVIAAANRYLGEDYIFIHKKNETPERNALQKPGYEKVVPPHKDDNSAYARAMYDQIKDIQVEPRMMDFKADVDRYEVSPLVEVYAAANPYNDIFDLTLNYRIGTNGMPCLDRVASYVNVLGTATKSYDQIHEALLALGSSITFNASKNSFTVNISGFDTNFDETLGIVADILSNVKGDKKKLKSQISDEKSSLMMARRDAGTLAKALNAKVLYGDNSSYTVDKGKYTDAVLLSAFEDVQKVECDITYSGTLSAEAVGKAVAGAVDLDKVSVASNGPVEFSPKAYDANQVFFIDKADANQSQIYAFMTLGPCQSDQNRNFSDLYSSYIGGGMASLLFQEIREFRSMAYSTGGSIQNAAPKNASNNSVLLAYVGTQCDKTIDAITIVDSLVRQTPFSADRLARTVTEASTETASHYPEFRDLAEDIATYEYFGYTADPAATYPAFLATATADGMSARWSECSNGCNIVWCIVGNSANIDMTALSEWGPITTYKPEDVIK